MLLKLLRNFHSSASNIKNLNKLRDNFSSQVESAEDSQAYFHLLFCRNTDIDPRLCRAIYLKPVQRALGHVGKNKLFRMMPKGQITGSSFCYAPFGPVLLYTHTRFAFLPAAK